MLAYLITEIQIYKTKPIVPKREKDDFKIIITDFKSFFLEINTTNGQKISKELENLSNAINQLGIFVIVGIYKALHPKTQTIYFFKCT